MAASDARRSRLLRDALAADDARTAARAAQALANTALAPSTASQAATAANAAVPAPHIDTTGTFVLPDPLAAPGAWAAWHALAYGCASGPTAATTSATAAAVRYLRLGRARDTLALDREPPTPDAAARLAHATALYLVLRLHLVPAGPSDRALVEARALLTGSPAVRQGEAGVG